MAQDFGQLQFICSVSKNIFFQTVIIYRIIQMFDKSQDDILDYSC